MFDLQLDPDRGPEIVLYLEVPLLHTLDEDGPEIQLDRPNLNLLEVLTRQHHPTLPLLSSREGLISKDPQSSEGVGIEGGSAGHLGVGFVVEDGFVNEEAFSSRGEVKYRFSKSIVKGLRGFAPLFGELSLASCRVQAEPVLHPSTVVYLEVLLLL